MEVGGTLLVRAAPGLVNLGALLILSHRLPTTEYGLYSTLVATGGFVASITYGLLYTPIVAQYRVVEHRGGADAYLGTLLMGALGMSAIVLLVGGAASWILGFPALLLLVTAMTGIHALLQEVARAKMRIWLYGTSDLIQAVTFLGAVVSLPNISFMLTAGVFAASFVPACAFSAVVLMRHARLSFDRAHLSAVFHPGKWLVLGTVTENLLFLGSRYVMLAFGAAAALGQFSLCLDLAQRSVGFVVNVTSFLYQPKAFDAFAKRGELAFRQVIVRGATIASSLGVLAAATLMAAALWPPTARLMPKNLDAATFVVVAAAVIMNRLKKLLVDPFAMREGRTRTLIIATAVGSLIGLGAVFLFTVNGAAEYAVAGYTLGYLLIAALSAYALRELFIVAS